MLNLNVQELNNSTTVIKLFAVFNTKMIARDVLSPIKAKEFKGHTQI